MTGNPVKEIGRENHALGEEEKRRGGLDYYKNTLIRNFFEINKAEPPRQVGTPCMDGNPQKKELNVYEEEKENEERDGLVYSSSYKEYNSGKPKRWFIRNNGAKKVLKPLNKKKKDALKLKPNILRKRLGYKSQKPPYNSVSNQSAIIDDYNLKKTL